MNGDEMRTSNVKLLSEIDILEEAKGVDCSELELVKRIEKLESKLVIFWVVSSKNTTLNFRYRERAEEFISKQQFPNLFQLVATTFADN